MTVYLLHFNRPYKHARHYLGATNNLAVRLSQHGTPQGARLMHVVEQAGITWRLARTWSGGWHEEKQLKRCKNAPRLCPYCNPRLRTEQTHLHQAQVTRTSEPHAPRRPFRERSVNR